MSSRDSPRLVLQGGMMLAVLKLPCRILYGFLYLQIHAALATASPSTTSSSSTSSTSLDIPAVIAPPTSNLPLKEALDLTITYNYRVRTRAEEVFRARQKINIAIGRLVPSLNMGVAFAVAAQAYVDAVLFSAGFLFPSNWFHWRESKLFFEAERSSFATLLANQVHAVESIYYRLGALHRALGIYTHYIMIVNQLVDDIPIIIGDRNIYEQPLRELFNLRLALTLDHQNIRRTLATVYPDFYHALGLDPQIWERYHVADINTADLTEWPQRDGLAYYPLVINRSQELRSLNFLVAASRFATYARAFEFLQPNFNQEGSLGFGTAAYIKTGRSFTREYELRVSETKSELRRSLDQTLADYQWSLASYETHHQQLTNAKELLEFLKKRFYELQYLKDDISDAISFMVSADIGINENIRIAQTAEAQLRRLLWQGDHYQRVLSIAFSKKPEESLKLAQKFENMKIKRAMRKGQLAGSIADAEAAVLFPSLPPAYYPVAPLSVSEPAIINPAEDA